MLPGTAPLQPQGAESPLSQKLSCVPSECQDRRGQRPRHSRGTPPWSRPTLWALTGSEDGACATPR